MIISENLLLFIMIITVINQSPHWKHKTRKYFLN